MTMLMMVITIETSLPNTLRIWNMGIEFESRLKFKQNHVACFRKIEFWIWELRYVKFG